MNAKQVLPKTYGKYSKGEITKDLLGDVALDEAKRIGCGRSHKVKKLFLNTLLFGTRTIGYSATAAVGASVLIPGFLAFDAMFSRINPALKYLYAYSFAFGATGLGLTSYYISRTTHNIAKAINAKIDLLKCIEKIDPQTAVNLLLDEINPQNPK